MPAAPKVSVDLTPLQVELIALMSEQWLQVWRGSGLVAGPDVAPERLAALRSLHRMAVRLDKKLTDA